MRALIINGSGRKDGYTSRLCESFTEGLETEGVGCDVVFPYDMNIGHCTGCGLCKEGTCVISDDMDRIYPLLEKCDILVLATPIRFSGPSSIIKTVLDRSQPYWYKGRRERGYAVGLLCGGGANPAFDHTVSIFKAFTITAGLDWHGYLATSGTDFLDIDETAMPAFNFGRSLISRLRSGSRI
jgi:multimeric flavodoxin WrbA